MFIQAMEMVFSAVTWVLDMFHYLADYFGFGGLLLTLFTIYTIIRLLLQPIFGQASSDFASSALSTTRAGLNPRKPVDGRIKGQQALPKGSKKK